jgi:hypothetical protein
MVTPPAWLKQAGENLARKATVSIPGSASGGVETHLLLNDGHGKVDDNEGRWICRAACPHIVEFCWDKPVTLGAARIISGYHRSGQVIAPIEDFTLQWHDGTQWQDTGIDIAGNSDIAWAATFPPVRTGKLRSSTSRPPRVRSPAFRRKGDVESQGTAGNTHFLPSLPSSATPPDDDDVTSSSPPAYGLHSSVVRNFLRNPSGISAGSAARHDHFFTAGSAGSITNTSSVPQQTKSSPTAPQHSAASSNSPHWTLDISPWLLDLHSLPATRRPDERPAPCPHVEATSQ